MPTDEDYTGYEHFNNGDFTQFFFYNKQDFTNERDEHKDAFEIENHEVLNGWEKSPYYLNFNNRTKIQNEKLRMDVNTDFTVYDLFS